MVSYRIQLFLHINKNLLILSPKLFNLHRRIIISQTWNVTSIEDYKSEIEKTKEPEDLVLQVKEIKNPSFLIKFYHQGLSWTLDVICDKNEVDNQDEWLNLGGGGGLEWDLMVLCSANKEDPDILNLGVS